MAEIFNFYVQDNRTILFPRNNLLEPIMQEDHKVATWRFRIPKVLNNIDMSAWAWWFVYVNAKNQKFSELLTLTNDIDDPENYCTADYSIGYGISKTPGGFTFALEAINTEQGGEISGEWHTRTYTHTVTPTLQGNQAEYAETESDIISALIVEVQNKINSLIGGATPLVVSSVSAMTDTSKIYVLSTDGNWYYHNGTTWVSGGTYASGITVDPVPTQGSTNAVSSGGVYEALEKTPETATPEETEADFYLSDENGNVLMELADGHIKTKNFDSADIESPIKESSKTEADLYISDSFGNVIAEFKDGHVVTKNFESVRVLSDLTDVSERIEINTSSINTLKRVKTRMCFGAHNGAEWYAPECTIPAYRIAGQQGWEWAWIAGIYFSSEGTMYVLHDGTVDRTTDGTGSIASMTDAQVNALNITQTGAGYDLSDFDPSELKIPTFEQVVQQCVKYGMKMVIRLSDFPNSADAGANKEKWDNFLAVLNGYGVQPENISCYLDTGTKAQTCRALIGDDVEISTHLGQSATASDFVDWFESRSITGKKAAILSYQNTNLEAVKLLHSHGIRVYSYGYNSQAQADNCALWGVDIYQNGRIYKITD